MMEARRVADAWGRPWSLLSALRAPTLSLGIPEGIRDSSRALSLLDILVRSDTGIVFLFGGTLFC